MTDRPSPLEFSLPLESAEGGSCKLDVQPCSENCLYATTRFTSAIRRHVGRGGYLLKTDANRLVKRRKHTTNSGSDFMGLRFPFNFARHEQALAELREKRPEFVSLPSRECSCSYEFDFVEGAIVGTPEFIASHHLRREPRLRVFRDGDDALNHVRSAARALRNLHALGVRHGDPGPHNFLEKGSDVYAIELDDVFYTGRTGPDEWEEIQFCREVVFSSLRPYFSAQRILLMCRDEGWGVRTLVKGLGIRLWDQGSRFAAVLAKDIVD